MDCERCGNKRDAEYYLVCDQCLSKEDNLPANLQGPEWITVLTEPRKRETLPGKIDERLRDFILASARLGNITPDSEREVVKIGGEMEIPVKGEAIDRLARESGLVVGKWLIYSSPRSINDVWKTVAAAYVKDELGVNIKVSTASQSETNEHVICVYTWNYLDVSDVERVREKLRSFGFDRRLYYKPDIYTYLQIYKKTFPQLRASRYSS